MHAAGKWYVALAVSILCTLAFAAHREAPAGAVLYAWLLHVGGQAALGRRAAGGGLCHQDADRPGGT